MKQVKGSEGADSQPRFEVEEFERETNKAYFHSSAGFFRRMNDVEANLTHLMQRYGIDSFVPNKLERGTRGAGMRINGHLQQVVQLEKRKTI